MMAGNQQINKGGLVNSFLRFIGPLILVGMGLQVAFAHPGGFVRGALPLSRYYNPTTGLHRVTALPVSPGFNLEATWFISRRPFPGNQALYECRVGVVDFFLSFDPNCEGQTKVSFNPLGYISQQPRPGTVGLYRCYIPGAHHFASVSPSCEYTGAMNIQTEALLGYVYQ
jgi:hypothetical protein